MAALRTGVSAVRHPALLLAALLAGCATVPPETPAEATARRGISCTEAGFAADTPDFRLCLLLQQTNERLAAVERRLGWIEQDASFARPYLGPGWWW
jgi:hypothetical protein